jgi:DNA-directed RNA polymerase specialized sigma24 family protein
MDIHVEKQCIDDMKRGDTKKFLMLFDANFDLVYKYVARRISDRFEVEKIVRLTFLDGLGQIQGAPTDIGYVVWLYSLARPRVWEYMAKASFPEKQGLIAKSGDKAGVDELVERAEKMMGKLSLEEREILRLKFFEQVSDGDVMTILGMEEGSIGPKIYRVLKRAHFLLFGESDERKGVYFGELSGFLERLRDVEEIEVLDVLKLNLRMDLVQRIERKDFAIDTSGEVLEKAEDPFEGSESVVSEPRGSNDPAKIFVEAVREMREDEAREEELERLKFEKRERFLNFIDRWKGILTLIPVALFVWLFVAILVDVLGNMKVERGLLATCDVEIEFDGEFSDTEKRNLNQGISNRLCDYFEVEKLMIAKSGEGVVNVEVDVPEWMIEYKFVNEVNEWRIKKYERTFDSNNQSGQV